MVDITAIVLTYNEELHIKRCCESLFKIVKRVIVVDCHSIDDTCKIAEECGAEIIEHDWPGNQAAQFNWALDNCKITTTWVLRLDADEYLSQSLIDEIENKLDKLDNEVSAIVLPLGRVFMGRELKHGTEQDVKMIRILRYGKVRYEKRLMDEHFEVLSGNIVEFREKFYDDNLMPISFFINKHNGYSSREAAMLLDMEYDLFDNFNKNNSASYFEGVNEKRQKKQKYAKMRPFWRSIGYFLYRYFVRLSVLDGKEGFLYCFFQGLWYRMLVDAKVEEAKRKCGNDKDKLRDFIRVTLGIEI